MTIARLKNTLTGEEITNLYYDWRMYHRDTFNPYIKTMYILPLKTRGETYAQLKESARNLAIAYSNLDTSGLSYQEYSGIYCYFENVAKRYGLRKEFKENGII